MPTTTLFPTDPRPIGVFDSGIGGLTVLRTLVTRFPNEHFIYLGDTARVPYGIKSARTVERYTLQVAHFLMTQNVKALIIACNTASALGLAALQAQYPNLPAIGVIQPGCRTALATHPSHVGIIATRSTIASGAYPHTLTLLHPNIQVTSLPCPLFVPLVEEGWLHHPATRLIVADSLQPLQHAPPQTLILGCTHYPLLAPVIADVLGPRVQLVDSARAVADELENRLNDLLRPAPQESAGPVRFLVTDIPDRFTEVAARFLGDIPVSHVEMVDL